MQEMAKVISQLQFGNGKQGVAHRGIAHAFPDAKLPSLELGGKGIYQVGKKPNPSCALISVTFAIAEDGRIGVVTGLGEELYLSNRSRVHNPSGIEKVTLQVREPTSEDDVGDVILVAFGRRTSEGFYQAVCEGILLCSAFKGK